MVKLDTHLNQINRINVVIDTYELCLCTFTTWLFSINLVLTHSFKGGALFLNIVILQS